MNTQLDQIRTEIERRMKNNLYENPLLASAYLEDQDILEFIKSLPQEPVSKDELIEIPFGAKDSELCGATYYIPEGFHATIEGNKIILNKS